MFLELSALLLLLVCSSLHLGKTNPLVVKKMRQKTLKNRTIFCRDNIEILEGINSNSIDLIYLDPPFNKNKIFAAPIGSSAEGSS